MSTAIIVAGLAIGAGLYCVAVAIETLASAVKERK